MGKFVKCVLFSFVLHVASSLIYEELDDFTQRRAVRSSRNSSKFIHQLWEPESTTAGQSLEDCIESDTQETDTSTRFESVETNTILATTESIPETTIDISHLSKEFRECDAHIEVRQICYEKLPNGSISVPVYHRIFNKSDFLIDEATGSMYICPTFFKEHGDNSKFSLVLGIVSVVGIGISTFCIILHILMFVLIKKLRNLPGYCLVSLCKALLIAYLCFFIHLGIPENSDCSYIGIILLYFFLASFFWMNAISYDVWRSLRMATAKLRLTADRPMMVRFGLYSLYCWGTPLLIVIIALIVNASDAHYSYKLMFSVTTCWFRYRQALLVYFALPLFILLFINVLFYISSFCMIYNASMTTSENKTDIRSRFFISMRLAVSMGLMWIFGILATATQATVLWYFFSVFNALQGLFIFFSFTLSEKTMKECKRTLQRRKCSTLPTQMTSQHTSSF